MRKYNNEEFFSKLRSPDLSGVICLTFAVEYHEVGSTKETKPEVSGVFAGSSLGQLNLKDEEYTSMNVQVQLDTQSPDVYHFDFHLKGKKILSQFRQCVFQSW